jgi:hypothetical protein
MLLSLPLVATLLLAQGAVAQTPAAQGALLVQVRINLKCIFHDLNNTVFILYSPFLAMENVSRLLSSSVLL